MKENNKKIIELFEIVKNQDGCATKQQRLDAKNEIMQICKGFVQEQCKILALYSNKDYDEIFHVGWLGLLKAINTYSLKRHSNFKSYARDCINSEINAYLANEEMSNNNISLSAPIKNENDKKTVINSLISSEASEMYERVEDWEMLREIDAVAENNLIETDLQIFAMIRAGLSTAEIAKKIGKSQSAAYCAQRRILRNLRRHVNKEQQLDPIHL